MLLAVISIALCGALPVCALLPEIDESSESIRQMRLEEKLEAHVKGLAGVPDMDPFAFGIGKGQVLSVNMTVMHIHVTRVIESNLTINWDVEAAYTYNFPGLTWEPSEFGNIRAIEVKNIWSPELHSCTRSERTFHSFAFGSNDKFYVHSNGTVTKQWRFVVNEPVKFDYTKFPYDEQMFTLCLRFASAYSYPMKLTVKMHDEMELNKGTGPHNMYYRLKCWFVYWELISNATAAIEREMHGPFRITKVILSAKATREFHNFNLFALIHFFQGYFLMTYLNMTLVAVWAFVYQVVYRRQIFAYIGGMALLNGSLLFIMTHTAQGPTATILGQYIICLMAILTAVQLLLSPCGKDKTD